MKNYFLEKYLIIIPFFLILITFPISTQQTITLSHPVIGPPNEKTLNLFKVYEEAFGEIGYILEIQYFPLIRCPIVANTGETDGIFMGDSMMLINYPNLRKVGVPILIHYYTLFTRDPDVELNGWDSLKESQYIIFYYRGLDRAAEMLTHLIPPERLGATNRSEEGLRLLAAGRSDAFIDVKDRVERIIARTPEFQEKIYNSGLMEAYEQNILLHEKYSNLIPELEIILKAMKQEGRF